MAVYDKNNGSAGDTPEDKLDSMVAAGEGVSPADDAATKAAQRRIAARERLEAKIAKDAAIERRRRRNIALIATSLVVVIALIVAVVLIVNKVKDDKARAEAAEAAKWASCKWVEAANPLEGLSSQKEQLQEQKKQLEEQKKQLEEEWQKPENQKQLDEMTGTQRLEAQKNHDTQVKGLEQQIAQLDAQLAYVPTAKKLLETKSREVTAPANGTYPRTGKTITTLTTSAGDVQVNLVHRHAACNTAAFEKLIKAEYFANTTCHRMTTTDGLAVLQCGDPTGTGMGGPGFNSIDEMPDYLVTAAGDSYAQTQRVTYPKGTVAVANSGAENTGSSQFFIVLADSQLPPNYSVIGTVDPKDFPVLDKIKGYGVTVAPGSVAPAEGEVTDGAPATPVKIESWSIVKTVGVEQPKKTNDKK